MNSCKTWEQRKLSDDVSSIDTGKSKFDTKESGDCEILGSTGVIGYDDSFDYEGDFLLTARVGANAGTLYRHSGKVKITDNTVFLQGSHIDFVFYLLNKFDLKKMSFGSGQPLIKASELKYLKLMMPVQNEEKEKIATYFLNLDSLITLHQRKLDKLVNVKKSMLEKMFPQQGSRIPEIRFCGFTDDWEQRKLSDDVSSIDTGKSKFDTKESGDCEILGSTGVIGYDDSFDYEGDFLLTARVGANAGTLYRHSGKVKITDNTVFLQGSHIDFVFYLLNKFDLKKMSFGSGQPLIKASELKYLKLMMPVQNEEKEKIATYFLNLDSLITLHQRKLDKLVNVKKSMLEKMFPQQGSRIPEIRFCGFTDDWEQRELGNIGQTYTGLSGKTKDDFGHGHAQFVTYMNVFSNPICNPKMNEPIEVDSKQNEVEVGDVFFTTSSETPKEVGMTSVLIEKQGKMYLNSFCFGYRLYEKYDSYYLAYMLRSNSFREKIIMLAQGISRYNISKNKVMEIDVFVPLYKEQMEIGKYFRDLDTLITLHQRVKSLKIDIITKKGVLNNGI